MGKYGIILYRGEKQKEVSPMAQKISSIIYLKLMMFMEV